MSVVERGQVVTCKENSGKGNPLGPKMFFISPVSKHICSESRAPVAFDAVYSCMAYVPVIMHAERVS